MIKQIQIAKVYRTLAARQRALNETLLQMRESVEELNSLGAGFHAIDPLSLADADWVGLEQAIWDDLADKTWPTPTPKAAAAALDQGIGYLREAGEAQLKARVFNDRAAQRIGGAIHSLNAARRIMSVSHVGAAMTEDADVATIGARLDRAVKIVDKLMSEDANLPTGAIRVADALDDLLAL